MDEDIKLEEKSFIFTFWKPLIAYCYILVFLFDFFIAPIIQPVFLHSIGLPPTAWVSLTLSYGGIFHIAIGTILGATAYTHGMANIESIRNMPDYSNVPMNNYDNINNSQPQSIIKHQHTTINQDLETQSKS